MKVCLSVPVIQIWLELTKDSSKNAWNCSSSRCAVASSKCAHSSTRKALSQARECEAKGLSPGAGLPTAEEQAEAAFADLINTSADQRGVKLTSKEVNDLSRGGRMWESGSTDKKSGGLIKNIGNVVEALSGGAHIKKDKYGRT